MAAIIELIGALARVAGAIIVVLFAILCLMGNSDAAGKVLAVGIVGALVVGVMEGLANGSSRR